MTADTIDEAIAEARRRQEISDRDVSESVAHFADSLRLVCALWNLTATGWFDDGAGTPTLAVRQPYGVHGVLKLAPPGDLDVAAGVMRAADGTGYARVLQWDASRGALLTERLGESLSRHSHDLSAQTDVVASVLVEAWRVPLDHGSPFTGKAIGLVSILDDLGERYGSQHSDAVWQAYRYASELARSERPEVVCHGDPHAGNVLRRADGWALIDPDGFVGERSYDLGVTLRDACWEIEAAEEAERGSASSWLRRECRRVAGLVDANPERVWAWAFVERVTTGLFLRWHGYDEKAEAFLSTADVLVRSWPQA